MGVRFTESLVYPQVNMLKDCRFCVVSWWHCGITMIGNLARAFLKHRVFFGTELTYVVVLSVWGDKASLWQRIIGSNFVICFLRSVA